MSKKFNLLDMLNQNSKTVASVGGTAEPFKIEPISVYDLEPSADNFYSIADTDDLKDSIEMMGIQQNLIVRKIPGTEKYKIIAGHRRRLACLRLAEEGKDQFEKVPCRVESNLDEIKEKIILIYTNSTTRQLSDWEKVTQLEQLKILLREYKKTNELPGRIREILAGTLNVSPSQIGRMESINDNLTPEFKEEFKNERINFSTAAELSRLPVADQKAVYEQHKENGGTDLKVVREKRSETAANAEPSKYAIHPEIVNLLNDLTVMRKKYETLAGEPAGERALKSLTGLIAQLHQEIDIATEQNQPLFRLGGNE